MSNLKSAPNGRQNGFSSRERQNEQQRKRHPHHGFLLSLDSLHTIDNAMGPVRITRLVLILNKRTPHQRERGLKTSVAAREARLKCAFKMSTQDTTVPLAQPMESGWTRDGDVSSREPRCPKLRKGAKGEGSRSSLALQRFPLLKASRVNTKI